MIMDLRGAFHYLDEDEREKFVHDRDELEKVLKYSDWEWLYKHSGNNPNKAKLKKKMQEYTQEWDC